MSRVLLAIVASATFGISTSSRIAQADERYHERGGEPNPIFTIEQRIVAANVD